MAVSLSMSLNTVVPSREAADALQAKLKEFIDGLREETKLNIACTINHSGSTNL